MKRTRSTMPLRASTPIDRFAQLLDREWANAVKERDLFRCRVKEKRYMDCQLDAAHIVGRAQSLNVRFRLINGLTLEHHLHVKYFHNYPIEWQLTAIQLIGQAEYEALVIDAAVIINSPSMSWYDEQRERLRDDLRKALEGR